MLGPACDSNAASLGVRRRWPVLSHCPSARHPRPGRSHRSLPSVTESDAEALVAQPVLITVKRDIRSGPREGCPVADPAFTLRAEGDPAAVNTVGRSRWCDGDSDGGCSRRQQGYQITLSYLHGCPHFVRLATHVSCGLAYYQIPLKRGLGQGLVFIASRKRVSRPPTAATSWRRERHGRLSPSPQPRRAHIGTTPDGPRNCSSARSITRIVTGWPLHSHCRKISTAIASTASAARMGFSVTPTGASRRDLGPVSQQIARRHRHLDLTD